MKLPILCYHKVGPESEEGRFLNVLPATLRAHIHFFRRRRMRWVRACDLAKGWPDRAVCLTFDDAFASTLTYGLEVLRSEEATASIYACGRCVGKTAGALFDVGTGIDSSLATWAQLADAFRAGCEIGNHTSAHQDLSQLSLVDQAQAIAEGDRLLRDHGFDPRSVCLPYGRHNAETVPALRATGAGIGLALSTRAATPRDERLLLPRIVIGYSDGVPKLLYKLYLRPRLGPSQRSHYV
ncbi:MAG TPA: polysaccharide deacetylase family protein [Fimbriimonadaceae bacterium]|nr:polysaccharide deacetylase family protein [Fimbriimonadaceae bacterium]